MSLIYWDTMLFVYWFEEHPVHADRIRHILTRMEQRKDSLCTSAFAVAETLVGPYKKGALEMADRIREAFRPPFIQVLPFTSDAANHYAKIRAGLRVSPADAIHLACAAEAGVDLFLTNDRGLAGQIVPGIQFIAGLDSDLF
ncbi:MAG: PIN domain-containing protein [Acidobacteriia bacterium]|nr:PIN domain-containing protein [Terriglobia bacterium]